MKSFLSFIKNVLLWSYDRGSWQYDVLCLLIACIIFMVPSSFFGDRDRPLAAQAKQMHLSASNAGETIIEITTSEINEFLKKENRTELSASPKDAISFYLRNKKNRQSVRFQYETVTDSNGRSVYRIRLE